MNSFDSKIAVAAPWGLTHYLPLNGFHPLYRSLFENRLDRFVVNSWDNILLSEELRKNNIARTEFIQCCKNKETLLRESNMSAIDIQRLHYCWHPNMVLTEMLDGNIEFHHTAPYPSMTRPFVFHCESFAPIFFPFAHQGTGNFLNDANLKQYYKAMFESELCLGIFSHLQETLDDISIFFDSKIISEKLFLSRIGLSDAIESASVEQNIESDILEPRFLFINSAHQNPDNFFRRGGHIVLRFLEHLDKLNINFKAYMRCSRPSNSVLMDSGVNIDFIESCSNIKIIWIENYLTDTEMSNLMKSCHFMLLPSSSLHSVSIMQAMRCGAVPVVSDTIGTSLYVNDGENGLMLKGVLDANWQTDENSGVRFDVYKKNKALDEYLVSQLIDKILGLLDDTKLYASVRKNAISDSNDKFSGKKFGIDFWSQVEMLIRSIDSHNKAERQNYNLFDVCSLNDADWKRVFGSPPQPVQRLYTGSGLVCELGGCYIFMHGRPAVSIHEWSAASEFVSGSIPLIFAKEISSFKGMLLQNKLDAAGERRQRLKKLVSKKLDRYPKLKKIVKVCYKSIDKYYNINLYKASKVVDLELCLEGFCGFNIVRYGSRYYAILGSDGAFDIKKVKKGGYSRIFEGDSVSELTAQIDIELIAENYDGYNIIRCESKYYAILQSDGAFDIKRINRGDYTNMFVAYSKEDVERKVKQSTREDRHEK